MGQGRKKALAAAALACALAPASGVSGGPPGGGDRAAAAPPRPIYTVDRTQSPLPADVVLRLRAVAADHPGNRPSVFMKVGDSISAGGVRGPFLACFDPTSAAVVDLGGRGGLAAAAEYFGAATAAGGESSFARTSLATEVARNAEWAVTGSPSPVAREVEAVHPGLAVVMFGSNDIQCFGCGLSDAEMASIYFGNMRRIVDELLARGVVPVVSSMPPRSDDAANLRRLPLFANAVRALAQGRMVPFVDYEREMARLPGLGLGGDGVHPTSCSPGPRDACRFDDATCGGRKFLDYGYNVRNLVTLEALDRLKRVLVDGVSSLDAAPPRMAGTGTWAAPFVADGLPFTDLRDPAREGSSSVKRYGCPGAPRAPGPEVVYRLVLPRETALQVAVLDGLPGASGSRSHVLYLLDASGRPERCLKAAGRSIATTLAAGTYHLVVDSMARQGGGEFAVVAIECAKGDATCR